VAGGVRALVMLARFCNHEGVQEQVITNYDLQIQFCNCQVSDYSSWICPCELNLVFYEGTESVGNHKQRILITLLQTECFREAVVLITESSELMFW
jgi:hypothetical protein